MSDYRLSNVGIEPLRTEKAQPIDFGKKVNHSELKNDVDSNFSSESEDEIDQLPKAQEIVPIIYNEEPEILSSIPSFESNEN